MITAFLGRNGAGKSTTVKILLGLVDDFEGEVDSDGFQYANDIKK